MFCQWWCFDLSPLHAQKSSGSRLICSQTQLDNIAHEQTIIYRQLVAGHVVGSRPKKGRKICMMILDLCSFTWLLAHQISDGRYICSVWRWCLCNRSELYKMKEPFALKQPSADTKETLLGHEQRSEARKERTCVTKKDNFLSFQGPTALLASQQSVFVPRGWPFSTECE